MTFEELKNFLETEQERLDKKFFIPDFEKVVFARMTKLSEEQGELANAIISYFSLQRDEKDKKGKENIAQEIADVLIVTFLLAKKFEIDIEECLEDKIEKIKKRNY